MEGLLSGFQNCPFCVEEGRDKVLLQRAGNKWGRGALRDWKERGE